MMKKQYDKKFKEDAAKYYFDHKDLGIKKCAEHLGISRTALGNWTREAKLNNGIINTRGSGNYESDEAKEAARLRKELRDTQDALNILKKAIGILGN
jgi:transposase